MYTIDIVLEAISLYNNNLSFRKTSKILQLKYKCKITRQTIMNWNKWMKNDLNKICKKRMTVDYCNNIILSKQKSFSLDFLTLYNVILFELKILFFNYKILKNLINFNL